MNRAYLALTLALLSVLACEQSEDRASTTQLTPSACKERCDEKQAECSEACATALCRSDCDNDRQTCTDNCEYTDAGARDAAAESSSSQLNDSDASALPRIDASVQAEQTQRIADSDAAVTENTSRTPTSAAGDGAAGSGGQAGGAAGSGGRGAAGSGGLGAAGSGGLGAPGAAGSFAPVAGTGGFGPTGGLGPEAGIGGPIPRVPMGGFGPTGGEFTP